MKVVVIFKGHSRALAQSPGYLEIYFIFDEFQRRERSASMFQFDWASWGEWSRESGRLEAQPSKLEVEAVQSVMLLHWQEHCVECAPPLCYSTCPLYVARKDRKCSRLAYGIVRNPDFPGLLPFGADLRFRRWGKLEAILTDRAVSISQLRWLDRIDRTITWVVTRVSDLVIVLSPYRRIHGALTRYRDRLLHCIGKRHRGGYDAFVVECHSFEEQPCKLIVELMHRDATVFRESLTLRRGVNSFSLPIPFRYELGRRSTYRLLVYPDENREIRVVFSWLSFVLFRNAAIVKVQSEAIAKPLSGKPAEKLKCVAWDLDNTLWRGVLVEDGEENLQIRPEAVRLIRLLDERGILQTIVSKNHFEQAMAVLRAHNLDEYFLYPGINWGRKSENLVQIANRLNINIDTFALIDDSAFERNEVAAALPMVRVYREDSLSELLELPEFDVPITEASRLRRKSYRTETEREKVREKFGENYLEFLRSCQLKLRVFPPTTSEEIARCLELIQRSNQLNLSGRRFDHDQFLSLLAAERILCVALECEDRFGNYGIVGFASVDLSAETPVARDFVLSCRVACKHVEHSFYSWLGSFLKRQGASQMHVALVKTARNRPLVEVFEEMPFLPVRSDGDKVLLSMDLTREALADSIVSVDDSAWRESEVR